MKISLHNSNLKKLISIVLLFSLFSFFLNINIYGQNKTLTMADAVSYAQNISKDYRNKKNSRATKRIQLTQATQAVSDARRKETTVTFDIPSLAINLPKKHAMPKEIDLLMKIPKIESDIKDITKNLEEIRLADKQKTESCFIDVYGYDQRYKLVQSILDEMNEKLDKMKAQLYVGNANEKDVLSLENKIKAQTTKASSLLQNLERQKEKLSELIGFDVSRDYLFKNPIQEVDIDRTNLEQIVNYSLNNDFTLFKARSAENIARRNVNEIYQIYDNKWGGIVKRIEADVKNDSDIDFDAFLDKYEKLLVDIDNPWAGYYEINLLLFKLKFPKEWLKGEYDGIRYFDDQKYAIFVALTEKEDAVNRTKAVEKELRENIKDGYETLKELWKVYNTSSELYKSSQKEYDRVYMANRLGQASYDEVAEEKSNSESAQETKFQNLLAYNKQLVAFDKLTCGAITALRKDLDIFLKAAQTGDSVPELEELIGEGDNTSDKIIYYINQAVDQRRVVFGLQVPQGFPTPVTHYEVLTPEKILIANKSEISKTISVLPISYKGSTGLLVRLYNNDKFVAEGKFDAIIARGKLDLKKENIVSNNEKPKEEVTIQHDKTLGLYNITNFAGNFIKKIRFEIPATQGVSFYKIIDEKEDEVGEKGKFHLITETFSYLGFALNDLKKLKVNFYDADYKLKFTTIFDEQDKAMKY